MSFTKISILLIILFSLFKLSFERRPFLLKVQPLSKSGTHNTSIETNTTIKNEEKEKIENFSEKLKIFSEELENIAIGNGSDEAMVKRMLFIMALVIISIVVCCLGLQVVISLTKNCKLALNAIAAHEKRHLVKKNFMDLSYD